MTNKILIGITMALILTIAQVGAVFAQEEPPISGTVQTILLETDPTTGETTTVLVTLKVDDVGTTQTVRLSVETAEGLGLVTTDQATGEVTVNEIPPDLIVNIAPSTIIADEGAAEEAQHPVGSALSDLFFELLGVDYETIIGYHEDGVGFGVIAQALWMTNKVEGNTETFQMILDAKQFGDFSDVILPDGSSPTLADGSTPTNWGQFKKAVMGTGKKDNLGTVMSGQADDSTETTIQENSTGNPHPNDKVKKDKSNKGNGKNK